MGLIEVSLLFSYIHPVSLSYYLLYGLLYLSDGSPYIVIYGIADIITSTPAPSLTYQIPSLSYSNHHPIPIIHTQGKAR